MFYRDRIVSVAWDGVALCAVTIEPFEVSLRGGGCGGAMGFQSARAGRWSCCAVPEGVCCPTSMGLVLGAEYFRMVRRRLAGVAFAAPSLRKKVSNGVKKSPSHLA